MQINVTFDQPLSGLPTGFVSAIDYVVNYLDQAFSNPVVINVDVGYGEIAGQSLGSGALGESEAYIDPVNYSTAVSALKNNEPSASQKSAYSTLPANSPVGGGTLWLTTAQEKSLGFLAANDPSVDGYVGFSSSYPFYYGSSGQPAPSQFYFIGVALHEFTEVMGRASYLGDSIAGTTSYSLMDLFRYSAAGTRQLGTSAPAYFSIDQGTTNLDNWNTTPGGDTGDWAASVGNNAFLAFSSPGTINSVTPTDLLLMNILGWNQAPASVVSGTVNVSSVQTSAGLVVVSGGLLNVLSGGTAISNILSGGNEVIFFGGLASGTVINSGTLYDYGAASGTIVSGGLDVVEAGGAASGTTVNNGGEEYVAIGGTASGTTLNGGFAVVAGTAVGATVNSGTLYDYGITRGTIVNGGVEVVGAGSTASGTTVNNGGEEYIVTGGTASGTTLRGGYAVVIGTAVGATINSGTLYDYGAASGTIVNGGLDVVEAGGTASGTIVNIGGEEYVAVGGTASGTTLSGGFAVVAGTAVGATVNTGTLYDYGITRGTIVNGGVEVVGAGSTASGTTVNNGGEEYVVTGGTASGTTLRGGYAVVAGTAVGATINSGTLYDYGITSGTIVNGGVEVVGAGGTASGTTVNNGGEEYVVTGGRVSGTTLNGGFGVIAGTAVGTKVNSGATLYDLGAASGTIVNSGGLEFVESGATANNTSISGGTVEIASGAAATGTVTFLPGAGGTLRLDDAIHYGGLIAGFGLPDQLDLTNISFVSGITSANFVESGGNTSGTLTVTDGTHTAQITLLGQYVTGNFHLQNDGHGGTLVLDPPAIVGDYKYENGVAHSIANNGLSDITLLGQYIAGASTLGAPLIDQRSPTNAIENTAVDYTQLATNRHT